MSQKAGHDRTSQGRHATDHSQQNLSTINDRYARKHLKPIAKSVYQHRKVLRLNGSLNGAIGDSGTGTLNV